FTESSCDNAVAFDILGHATSGGPAADFGLVKLQKTKSKTIAFTIDAGFTVSAIDSVAPFAASPGNCLGVTGPATCKLKASFTPKVVSPAFGSVQVTECPTVGGTCPIVNIALTGEGLSTFGPSPAYVKFGKVAMGATKDKTFSVKLDPSYTFDD